MWFLSNWKLIGLGLLITLLLGWGGYTTHLKTRVGDQATAITELKRARDMANAEVKALLEKNRQQALVLAEHVTRIRDIQDGERRNAAALSGLVTEDEAVRAYLNQPVPAGLRNWAGARATFESNGMATPTTVPNPDPNLQQD